MTALVGTSTVAMDKVSGFTNGAFSSLPNQWYQRGQGLIGAVPGSVAGIYALQIDGGQGIDVPAESIDFAQLVNQDMTYEAIVFVPAAGGSIAFNFEVNSRGALMAGNTPNTSGFLGLHVTFNAANNSIWYRANNNNTGGSGWIPIVGAGLRGTWVHIGFTVRFSTLETIIYLNGVNVGAVSSYGAVRPVNVPVAGYSWWIGVSGNAYYDTCYLQSFTMSYGVVRSAGWMTTSFGHIATDGVLPTDANTRLFMPPVLAADIEPVVTETIASSTELHIGTNQATGTYDIANLPQPFIELGRIDFGSLRAMEATYGQGYASGEMFGFSSAQERDMEPIKPGETTDSKKTISFPIYTLAGLPASGLPGEGSVAIPGASGVQTDRDLAGYVNAAGTFAHIGDGRYRYTFSNAEVAGSTEGNIWLRFKLSGFRTVTIRVPLRFGQVDVVAALAAATIRDAVLDAARSGHVAVGSVGEAIALSASLLQGNFLMDSVTNTANGQTVARLRCFNSGADAAAATAGGSGEGEFATFAVTTTYSGPNKIVTHRVVQQ